MHSNTDWQAPLGPNPHRRKRWYWIGGLTVVVVAAVVAAIVLVPRWNSGRTARPSAAQAAVPGEVLLPSLREHPVVGWRTNVAALAPGISPPFIARLFGYIDNRAYFTLRGSAEDKQWVVGLNIPDGTPLFPAVEMPDYGSGDCYTNGPQRLVCFNTFDDHNSNNEDDRGEVSVIDAATGSVITRNPTELISEAWSQIQVGDYLVVTQGKGAGWHGLGDQGEQTWFVPGDGGSEYTVNKRYFPGDPVSNIVVSNGTPKVVFSAVDGRVLTPQIQGWLEPIIGGFVVMDNQSPSKFHFFNEQGAQVGEYQPEPGVSAEIAANGQRAVVTVSSLKGEGVKQLTFDNEGNIIAETKTHSLGDSIRFIGNYMYAGPDAVLEPTAVWNKYELTQGVSISSCTGIPLDRNDFIGSDGTVVLGRIKDPNDALGGVLAAVDSNTCNRLWEMPYETTTLWTIGDTLLQTLDDTGEITSLVPPPGA